MRYFVVLGMIGLLVLVGCGGGNTAGTASTTAKTGTLDKVKKDGKINWGADASGGAPFVYIDPKDKTTIIGFEVDIMNKLAGHLGLKNEIVQNQWDSLIPELTSGRSDIVMNGIEINDERKKVVLFSEPYFVYEQQLTVRAEDKDKYKSLDDLKGKPIATLKGAEANNVLKRAGWTDEQIQAMDDSQTPYTELENKRVEAVLQENLIADYYAGKNPKQFNVTKTFSPGKYAVAVRKGDEALLAEIDKAIQAVKKSGELAEIYKKWGLWNDLQKEIGIEEKK